MATAAEQSALQAREDLIFALDIGTRSIIGIVGEQRGDVFHVLGVERMDHPKRAMLDGQIEDIDQTAKIAGIVKERLEKKLDLRLHHVCVAAAGRALKTQHAEYGMDIRPGEAIDAAKVSEVELQAVQQAYEEMFEAQQEEGDFFCVGYSVVRYLLDGYPISTLTGHRGKHIQVEIIATFLPDEVVESLYTAMDRIGLSVASLTLEPIAAMNAIIPRELRLLNLALVDIGAGTSDIAICKGGSIAAYTMATVAGDEISEVIIREYLVDFETAERIKLGLDGKVSRIDYTDILGFSYSVSPEEILEKVAPETENLCATICGRILETNGQPPAAVFLVGGGSQLPFLCDRVAEKLGIDRNKVAVGSNNYMKKAVDGSAEVSGPEFATPVGIALTAALAREQGDFAVTVNGSRARLFKNGVVSVMDVLSFCGYQHSQLIGRSGQSVTFQYNGQPRTIRGGLPEPAVIRLCGKPAILSTQVKPGDEIEIEPAQHGANAAPVMRDLAAEWNPFEIQLNGIPLPAGTVALLNGEAAGPQTPIRNQDDVSLTEIDTLEQLCVSQELDMRSCCFWINGEPCSDPEHKLEDGDEVFYATVPNAGPAAAAAPDTQPSASAFREPALEPALPAPEEPASPVQARWELRQAAGGETDQMQAEPVQARREAPAHPAAALASEPVVSPAPAVREKILRVQINDRRYTLPPKPDDAPYQFVDMLNYVEIDPSKPQGNIILRLNGKSASYLETIHDGDRVDIFWDKP
ncbi:MAG: cell division protein FtsA [Provencibacterium sp.]|jgi:cell division protein FtsA|nr:cell division protein FtsA [Provencibacterium sp.]